MSKIKKQELRKLITTFPIDYAAIESELAYLQNRLTKSSYERFVTNTILKMFWSNRTYAVYADSNNSLLGGRFSALVTLLLIPSGYSVIPRTAHHILSLRICTTK